MFLKRLSLNNYKNIEASRFDFEARINCFIGNNGIGKSNVLDSIYHLAFTKSYFNPSSQQNIQFGKDFFMIEGQFKIENKDEKIPPLTEKIIEEAENTIQYKDNLNQIKKPNPIENIKKNNIEFVSN